MIILGVLFPTENNELARFGASFVRYILFLPTRSHESLSSLAPFCQLIANREGPNKIMNEAWSECTN